MGQQMLISKYQELPVALQKQVLDFIDFLLLREAEVIPVDEIEDRNEKLRSVIKPLREFISIEEMIEKQGYVPIEKKVFYDKVSQLNIEEPLEELLAMLNK